MLLKNVLKDAKNLPGAGVTSVEPWGEFSSDSNCDRILKYLREN
ncbi:hypothetical protein [Laspinema sp. D2d]|nr:hypothetical protein [Laspinema sp. D2d]